MFRLLCFEYKIVSVDYFLDDMTQYELDFILPNVYISEKQNWERTRLSSYISALSVPRKKKLKMDDIIKFPWDDEKEEKEVATQEDLAKLSEKATMFESMINDGKIIMRE